MNKNLLFLKDMNLTTLAVYDNNLKFKVNSVNSHGEMFLQCLTFRLGAVRYGVSSDRKSI